MSHPTWLHRLPAATKLMALVIASVLLLPMHHPGLLAASACSALAAYLSLGRPGLRRLTHLGKTLGPMILVLASLQWISIVISLGIDRGLFAGLEAATVTVGRLLTLVLLADLVTLSTPTQDLLQALSPILAPLRRLGLPTEKIRLAIGLMLRWVSLLQAHWIATKTAFAARGCSRPKTRLISPVMLGAGRTAQRLAEALAARQMASRSPEPDRGQTRCASPRNGPG
ncbi:MAG: hypothetical protein RL258_939 [Pseudomonadota bacterium]